MLKLLTKTLAAPIMAPIYGSKKLLERIHDMAHDELYDPASIKRQLINLEEQLDAGMINEDQFEEVEALLLDRLETVLAGSYPD